MLVRRTTRHRRLLAVPPRAGGDDGFTLVETIVALTVATVIFTATGAALVSAIQSVVVGRTNQQAAEVAEQAMESARALGYSALAIREDSLVDEPAGLTASRAYDPATRSATGSGAEPLVVDPAGSVQHRRVEVRNNGEFEVLTYVTAPTDANAEATYKRVTVVVSWEVRGQERVRTQSTLVSQKISGLPLPDYKFTPLSSTNACASTGGVLEYQFNLKNNGARDSWRVTVTGSAYDWTFTDLDGNDLGTPAVVGPLEPTQSMAFRATAPAGGTVRVEDATFTVTSTTTTTSSASIDVRSNVQTQPCTGSTVTATPTPTESETEEAPVPPPQPTTVCPGTLPDGSTSNNSTLRSYYLQNAAVNDRNTAASNPLGVGKQLLPTSTTLWNYSTDLHEAAGRALRAGASGAAGTVEWRYQLSSSTRFTGNGVVRLWGAPSGTVGPRTYTVKVLRLNSSGSVLATLDTESVTVGACDGFTPFGSSIAFGSGNGTNLNANDIVAVRVTVSGGDAVLAYDTTTFPAEIVLPVKSGG